MARICNGIVTLLNLLTLILSICVIGFSLWLYVKVDSPCEKALRMPLLIVGGALLLVSIAGLLGSCCAVSFFMWIYLIALFLLILALTAFTLFSIVVTNKTIGDALAGAGKTVGSRELGEYSWWLQKYVINQENWDEIKSCMAKAKICQVIEEQQTYKQKLSPIQWGCCKAPSACGNATKPDPDCKKWSSDPTQLCLDCDSCKTAALDNIRKEWRTLAIVNSCVLLVVTIMYSIGCCALRSNKSHSHKKKKNLYG